MYALKLKTFSKRESSNHALRTTAFYVTVRKERKTSSVLTAAF